MMIPIVFKYLEIAPLAGRGGVQRFFMLANDLPFDEVLLHPSEQWPKEKARLLESGENPCAALPVSEIDGHKGMSQHIAVCRYLAVVHKILAGDDYNNYVQDLVADEYQGWRDAWATAAFSSDTQVKETYEKDGLVKQLAKFDALFAKYSTAAPYLSTSASGKPLWGDSAIFGLIYDNMQTGFITEELLDAHPNLKALFKEYGAIPAVAKWIDAAKK